jgi:hypothetical protein
VVAPGGLCELPARRCRNRTDPQLKMRTWWAGCGGSLLLGHARLGFGTYPSRAAPWGEVGPVRVA